MVGRGRVVVVVAIGASQKSAGPFTSGAYPDSSVEAVPIFLVVTDFQVAFQTFVD